MDVTNAYAYTVKNLPELFHAIQKASVPPKFTNSFLQTLGFKSTNDRSFINVLKGLGFLDSNASPTAVYSQYKDRDIAKKILAQQIRKAYAGIFMSDENAQSLSGEAIKGKLATLTGRDESVIDKMASTFKTLVALADFSGAAPVRSKPPETLPDDKVESPALQKVAPSSAIAFSHVLYINLPATKDISVYDAIFKSMREHLL